MNGCEDRRADRQGDEQTHKYSQALLHRLQLTQCCCKKGGGARGDARGWIRDKQHQTEREENFGQNCIAQTKLEVRQSVRLGQEVFRLHTQRERESSQSVHSCRRTSGDAGLETVSDKTQPKTLCRAEKLHAPWSLPPAKTKVNYLTHVHTNTHCGHQHTPTLPCHWHRLTVREESEWKDREDVIRGEV